MVLYFFLMIINAVRLWWFLRGIFKRIETNANLFFKIHVSTPQWSTWGIVQGLFLNRKDTNQLKDLYPDLFSRTIGKEARISELISISPDGGSRSWNTQFHRAPYDWEEERVFAFYELIYSKMPRGEGTNSLFWKLTPNGVFDVRSFYNSLYAPPTFRFPWKCIWSSKVPKRVSFFFMDCRLRWYSYYWQPCKKELVLG